MSHPRRTFSPLASLLIGFASAALAVATPARADVTVDRREPAAADGVVEVELVSGSIEARAWDRDEVEVTGTIGDEVEELRIERRGNRLRIEVVLPDRSGSWRGGELDADLILQVPRGSGLEVETVSADVDVGGVGGRIEIETVSGKVALRGAVRDAELETVSGGVSVDGALGELRAATVSGRLRLRGSAESVYAKTVSGDASIELDVLDRVEAQSVSGRLELAGALAAGARVEAQSHSGGLTLTVPGSSSARFSIETFSGDIRNDLGPPARRKGRYGPGKSVEFTVGDGAAQVHLQAFSGSVTLRAR